MPTPEEVAANEILAIDALYESTGKTFPCVEGRHNWSKREELMPKTTQVCSKCNKRYRYPKFIGIREGTELQAHRERMAAIAANSKLEVED